MAVRPLSAGRHRTRGHCDLVRLGCTGTPASHVPADALATPDLPVAVIAPSEVVRRVVIAVWVETDILLLLLIERDAVRSVFGIFLSMMLCLGVVQKRFRHCDLVSVGSARVSL